MSITGVVPITERWVSVEDVAKHLRVAKDSVNGWAKHTDYATKVLNRPSDAMGFTLTILQLRLTSSPEELYESSSQPDDQLEKRLCDMEESQRSAVAKSLAARHGLEEDFEELDEAPDNGVEVAEEQLDAIWMTTENNQTLGLRADGLKTTQRTSLGDTL